MAYQSIRILLVGSDPDDRGRIRDLLGGHEVIEAADRQAFEAHLASGGFDLVMVHLDAAELGGTAVIGRVREAAPGVPVIILDDVGDGEAAFRALRQGAADYVPTTQERLRRLPGIIYAVMARVQAERAAEEAEARFRQLAENAPDIIFRWSYAHGYEYVSPAAAAVIGYTPEEHYADPGLGYRAIHPDDLPIYEGVLSDLADPEGPRRLCVIRWRHKDGHYVYVEMHMTPIFDERGQLIAIEGINRDISEHVLAKQRLRELSSRIIKVGEEERQRIARELHDEVGQALMAVKMGLRMADRALPDEGAEKARDRLANLAGLVDNTIASVRSLSHELRPPLLDEVGLEPALAWLCDSFWQYTGLRVQYSGEMDLPPGFSRDAELAIYRIVQEALTNAARHAHPSAISVQVICDAPGVVIATVEDDGCGFDVRAVRRSGVPGQGLGILGMHERADLVGGQLTIESVPGKGTCVCVRIPLQEAPA
jgi:two-component system sensor histidine kinase UhpB